VVRTPRKTVKEQNQRKNAKEGPLLVEQLLESARGGKNKTNTHWVKRGIGEKCANGRKAKGEKKGGSPLTREREGERKLEQH